jgi:hypothetical protein
MTSSYELKRGDDSDTKFNVARINMNSFNVDECAHPVYLYRGQPVVGSADLDQSSMEDEADAGKASKKKPFKRRTMIFYSDNSEARALRQQEALPWILQDADEEVNCVGRLEGDQKSSYAIFVYNVLLSLVIKIDSSVIERWLFQCASGE